MPVWEYDEEWGVKVREHSQIPLASEFEVRMRWTVYVAPDVKRITKELAARHEVSLGEFLSDLVFDAYESYLEAIYEKSMKGQLSRYGVDNPIQASDSLDPELSKSRTLRKQVDPE